MAMAMTMPQVTLVLAAACAILNLWLAIRVGQVRRSEKVSVGDGGNDRVIRRMRAHANFTENGWVVLALVLVIELSAGPSVWLWGAAALFVAARIAHGVGMDGAIRPRAFGTAATFLLQLVLAIWAVSLMVAVTRTPAAPATETMGLRG